MQVALSFDAWKKILIKSKMNYLIICIYRSSFRNLIDFFKCIKKEEVGCNDKLILPNTKIEAY